MNELLAHLVGDYVLQTRWMATQKLTRLLPAVVHGLLYTLPFLLITTSWPALVMIGLTHVVIDRFSLGQWFAIPDAARPVWLIILLDNTLHLLINHLALTA